MLSIAKFIQQIRIKFINAKGFPKVEDIFPHHCQQLSLPGCKIHVILTQQFKYDNDHDDEIIIG